MQHCDRVLHRYSTPSRVIITQLRALTAPPTRFDAPIGNSGARDAGCPRMARGNSHEVKRASGPRSSNPEKSGIAPVQRVSQIRPSRSCGVSITSLTRRLGATENSEVSEYASTWPLRYRCDRWDFDQVPRVLSFGQKQRKPQHVKRTPPRQGLGKKVALGFTTARIHVSLLHWGISLAATTRVRGCGPQDRTCASRSSRKSLRLRERHAPDRVCHHRVGLRVVEAPGHD